MSVTDNNEAEKKLPGIMVGQFGLNTLAELCHGEALRAGWWHDLDTGELKDRNPAETLALIHSEISETLEAVRKGGYDKHLPNRPAEEVELADALIRIMDYAGGRQLDVAGAVVDKLLYNRERSDHQIENRRQEGGKKL